MSRLIEKLKQLKTEHESPDFNVSLSFKLGYIKAMNDAINLAQAYNCWINVDERLPEPQNFCRPTDFIRFICSDGYVYDGFYYRHHGEDGEFDEGFNVCNLLAENGKWCVDEREILHSGDTITHWRPLPEPPEGE